MDKRPVNHVTRALITFALLLFFITELEVITSLWGIPNGTLVLGIVAKYILPFVVSLPMVAGVRGYLHVRRRMVSTDYETVDILSHRFLLTIIVAYAAIAFMVSALRR